MKTDTSNFMKPGAPKHREAGLHGGLVPRHRLFPVLSLLGAIVLLLCGVPQGQAGIVYESPTEFLASGDFNADGILDVLVLDKTTGNARVGYQGTNGFLSWSAPLVTSGENATGCGIGKFLQSNRDAVAVTSPSLNRINLVDLSNTNVAGSPVIIT
ncbi:MAG: hypothetical protein JWQ71_1238, partial [Pedosphaera sp.]|nr:hypothetical protein [Pedosphaera sp.]